MAVYCAQVGLIFFFMLCQDSILIQSQFLEPGEGYGEDHYQGGRFQPMPNNEPWQYSQSGNLPGGGIYRITKYSTGPYNSVRPPLRPYRWINNGISFGGNHIPQIFHNSYGDSQNSGRPFQFVKKFYWWTPKQQEPDVQTNPVPYPGGFGLQFKHMKQLLDDHNAVRSYLRAANVYKMKWSNQLASEALSWIQHCQMEHQHQGRGENLAMVFGYGVNMDMLVNTAVDGWYKEKQMWKYGDGFSSATGHYTQMIWCSSKTMGCAAKRCSDKLLLACFYSPQGNIIGQLPYKIGSPCSQCKPNSMCQSNLCLW